MKPIPFHWIICRTDFEIWDRLLLRGFRLETMSNADDKRDFNLMLYAQLSPYVFGYSDPGNDMIYVRGSVRQLLRKDDISGTLVRSPQLNGGW